MSRRIAPCVARRLPLALPLILGVIAVGSAGAQQQAPPKQSSPQSQQAPRGKSFKSPDEAASVIHGAAKNNDEHDLMVILGPGAHEMLAWTDDSKEQQNERAAFARKYDQMHRLVHEPDGTVQLYVGAENWPFPIPLVEVNGAWYFDTELGKKEILYRRVGRNESEALEVCHALVDAEKDYYSTAHAYSARFISKPGAHDGLYWAGANSPGQSPIGPLLAHAGVEPSGNGNPVPFHGYYYRILVSQGPGAPGGAQHYPRDGKMTGGFAILAFPAEYRQSGVMTFIMDDHGVAYEKDLGPKTDAVAKQVQSYNPDSSWKKVME